MALTECANGHLYDDSQYQTCPYCNTGTNQVVFGAGVGKTVGVGAGPAPAAVEIGATVAPASYNRAGRPDSDRDTGKTVAVLQKKKRVKQTMQAMMSIMERPMKKEAIFLAGQLLRMVKVTQKMTPRKKTATVIIWRLVIFVSSAEPSVGPM